MISLNKARGVVLVVALVLILPITACSEVPGLAP
mgnify:CR=1 FL=1